MNTAFDPALDFAIDSPQAIATERLLPALAALREQAPVYWSERNQCWHITRHADVTEALQDIRYSNVRLSHYAFRSIPEAERPAKIPNLLRYITDWIVNVDGEQHRRLRSVTGKALNKKFVDSLLPLFDTMSAELTEKAVRLKECDFIADIAYYLPATVILNLLGLSHDYLDKVREWNAAIVAGASTPFPPPASLVALNAALEEMNGMLRAEISKRRQAPTADFLTQLITLSDESNQTLSEDEVLGICHVLLSAGHETTVNSLAFGLAAWVKHPEQRELFLSGAVDPMNAMQELSRLVGMSTMQPRVAAEDIELHGQRISKGDVVFLWVLSTNHDPELFPEPERFDISRPNLSEVKTFGPGLHHCIGHYLARAEMVAFYRHFLPRFSRIEILDEPLAMSTPLSFRGLAHLNARFTV